MSRCAGASFDTCQLCATERNHTAQGLCTGVPTEHQMLPSSVDTLI